MTEGVTQAQLRYQPRPIFTPLHQRNARWACVVAHRRAGKTVACVNELVIRALYSPKHNPRYAYIAPFYSQAKQVAWEYLKEAATPFIQSFKDVRESELSVRLVNESVIRLYGADNPDALRGIYLDGAVLDEYGDCRPSLWPEVILPTLADRKGWAAFIGTAKGKNHFFDVLQRSLKEGNWLSMMLKASETHIIPEEELLELKAQMSEAQYAQEMECDFTAAVLGTYYAQIIQLLEQKEQIHPTQPTHDPNIPTYVAADLGYKDSTALWFWQHAPDGIAVIDYEEHHSKPLEFYFNLLDDKPYDIQRIFLPHDARAKTLQTGRSTVEQFLDPPHPHRPYPIDIVPQLKVQQGIDAARLVLPHCYFNQQTCYAGIEALRAYRRRYDELLKSFSATPLHDWACLPAGEMVRTPIGLSAIETLCPGDHVTVAGETPAILNAGYRKLSRVLKVTLADGTSFRATPEHKVFSRLGLVMCGTLRVGDQLIRDTDLCPTVLASDSGIREAFIASFSESSTGTGRNAASTSAKSATSSECFTVSGGNIVGRSQITAPSPKHTQWCLKTATGRISARIIGFAALMRRTADTLSLRTRALCFGGCPTIATVPGSTITPSTTAKSGRYTAKSTRIFTAPSRRGITSTISTIIERITTRLTSGRCLPTNTTRTTSSTVTAIERQPSEAVYDIEVAHHHAYVLDNGVVVSNSDGADAFRYLALVARDKLPTTAPKLTVADQVTALIKPPSYQLDTLWKDAENKNGRFQFQRTHING